MSTNDGDKEFFEIADAFINLANEQCQKRDPGKVSGAFLYAAARFNTFLVAAGAGSADEFGSKKDDSIEYFMTRYKEMLGEHFENYHENFEKYIGKKK
jgi:class 3 adenylate cyclase